VVTKSESFDSTQTRSSDHGQQNEIHPHHTWTPGGHRWRDHPTNTRRGPDTKMLLGNRPNWTTYGRDAWQGETLIMLLIAHIAYFVALLKIADFLHAGVEVSLIYPVVDRVLMSQDRR
jgi:hypothetical protein